MELPTQGWSIHEWWLVLPKDGDWWTVQANNIPTPSNIYIMIPIQKTNPKDISGVKYAHVSVLSVKWWVWWYWKYFTICLPPFPPPPPPPENHTAVFKSMNIKVPGIFCFQDSMWRLCTYDIFHLPKPNCRSCSFMPHETLSSIFN